MSTILNLPAANSIKNVVQLGTDSIEIEALFKKYKDISPVDTKSFDELKKGIAAFRDLRGIVKKTHEEKKRPILDEGNALDAEKNKLIKLIQENEAPLIEKKDIYEAEKQRIKDEKTALEAARIASIQAKIAEFNNLKLQTVGKNSKEIDVIIVELSRAMTTDTFDYQEFKGLAQASKETALNDLIDLFNKAEAQEAEIAAREAEQKAQREAEAIKLAAEYERLARLKAEQDTAQAKRLEDMKVFEAEKRKLEEERAALEADKARAEAEKLAEIRTPVVSIDTGILVSGKPEVIDVPYSADYETADDGYDIRTTLVITRNDERIAEYSDGGEPEDNSFTRDWNWVGKALDQAYQFGYNDGKEGLNNGIKQVD